ncbi:MULTISPECIES: DEAD/DEAH box helicase [Halorussus]|uniref:DEAD/DEAH box helicase n=1 Tax=Halorussus TaxID=1070314 RepID=UPI00209F83FE|nr:DEAD/DEAH box helicase [Halorussus vallis]USZ78734.1 DEAD/DEAH box helicase [Halorussus vallis]
MSSLPHSLSPDDKTLVGDLLAAHGFNSLTDTQYRAFDERILDGGNHLLVAETGNGKTLCAEAVTKQMLDAGGRVAYLVPSNQLVGAKEDELNTWAEGEYDVQQGGYQNADVIVATFDSFYQAILRGLGDVRSLDLVILDDFHIIYDSGRGRGLEKAIAAVLDNNINIFAMSATVGNPEELADWMDANLVISDEQRSIEIQEQPVMLDEQQDKKPQIIDQIRGSPDKAPYLVFNGSKPKTEARAEGLAETNIFANHSDRRFHSELRSKLDGMEPTRKLHDLATLMSKGVAYHHAGLPSSIRNWIEECFEEGEIAVLFCTPTLAYGFDAPVQSVVVADLKRWNGAGVDYIHTYEYIQWIGRAARPGKGFKKGYAFPFYSDFDEASKRFFNNPELEPVTSHVDSGDGLRWLVLELVEMGWDTPEAIEDFLTETLYWQQLSGDRAWDDGTMDKRTRMQQKLREEADWLQKFGFLRERETEQRFENTRQGSAAVEFNFNVFRGYSLRSVHDLCADLENKDTFTALNLLYQFSAFSDAYLSFDGISTELQDKILNEEMIPEEDAAIVAGVLGWYWCQGVPATEIEERTNVDPTSIRMAARNLSMTLEAATALFDAIQADKPEWYDDFVACVEKGVPREDLPVVRHVYGVGRVTIRNLRDHFSTLGSSDTRFNFDTETLVGGLCEAYEQVERKDQLEAVLQNVNRIGKARATRLVDFAEQQNGDRNVEPLFGENAVESESGGTTSFSRNSSLNEFL